MNPSMHINKMKTKVSPETSHVLNNKFWYSLDGVAGALDNWEARAYLDRCCLFYQKPCIDSATLATQCTTQVVQPNVTTSWSAGALPPTEETYQLCTVRALPNKIDHTIHYARHIAFQENFVDDINVAIKYSQDPSYLQTLVGVQKKLAAKSLERTIINTQKTFEDCVEWAYRYFEQEFVTKPSQLLMCYPSDMLLPDGAPFWIGTHAPKPITLNLLDNIHVTFLVSATYLRASTLGIISEAHKEASPLWEEKVDYIKSVAEKISPMPFVPQTLLPEERDISKLGTTVVSDEEYYSILERLPKQTLSISYQPLLFEKDDDTNFHVDFIHSVSTLRARLYSINPIPRLKTKLIVGKIIPAIITATAVVAGLASLEIIKQQQWKPLEDFHNTSCNLALPFMERSTPDEPIQTKLEKIRFNNWTRLDIPGPARKLTLRQIRGYLAKLGIFMETLVVKKVLLWMGEETKLDSTCVFFFFP
eukprot:TRINITY_DN3499_c0_g1_i1.p2 TRINITY_DN3499_c0_g1~~TRINITY_DN3499_c0_g1_i1.p2  ORF type:complete len:476 (-),score=113.81 TRINITY_DN3499_c0_g1_i1:341-1768(-)